MKKAPFKGNASRGGQSKNNKHGGPKGPTRTASKGDGPKRSFSRPERDDRPARSEGGDRPFRSDRPARPARSEGGDRPFRGDRPARPARSEGGDRPFRGDRPARPARSEGGDRPFRADRPARPARSEGGDRPFRADRPARPARSEGGDRPFRADRPARPARSEGGDRPFRADRPARPARSEGGDRPFRGDRPARPARTERKERPASTPRLNGALLWGTHAVRAAILNENRTIIRILASDGAISALEQSLNEANTAGIERPTIERIEKILFDRLLPEGAVHQGVAAIVEPLEIRDAHDLVAGLEEGEDATIVLLDQVTDPHNVGAILRSAAAFGAKGVILQDRHAPELTGVLAKTACGAVDVLPVALETNLSRAIELLQEHGFCVIGLDERGTALGEVQKTGRTALVLGAEGAGLRRLVAEHCDVLAALPTQGPIWSLNVSNAAAVALYALKA